ncbi:unnamed protein product [Arctogadus glacialis]
MSLSPSSGGERDVLRCSHDSLLLSSIDELRSNSDGDSSSGLEMESIVVSGSVTESKGGQSDGLSRAWQSGSAKPVGDAGSLLQAAEETSDCQSNYVVRSMSSSLRHPSDHFLKTREEVYVHSQMSMEDSDDGIQSPSATPHCPPLLGVEFGWNEPPADKDMPSNHSEQPSPELTHSSFSHNSSYISTPVSESGQLTERAWAGSPFAGDLMEEVCDEEDGGDFNSGPPVSSFRTEGQGKEREGGGYLQMPCTGRTKDLMGGECTAQLLAVQTMESTWGVTSQSREDSSSKEPTTLHGFDGSQDQEIGDSSSYSQSQRHMDGTAQAFALPPPCGNILYQWTRDASSTECQAKHGYNYHHTDQRVDSQGDRHGDPDSSVDWLQDTSDSLVEWGCEPGVFISSEQGDYAASIQNTGQECFNQDDEGEGQDGSYHRGKLEGQPIDGSLDHSEGSLTTDNAVESDSAPKLNTGGTAAGAQEPIPEYSAAEERRDSLLWRSVAIGDQDHRVDMKCIEPYRRVVSHGGYYGDQNAIIVFAACFLPDSNCENYNYVMENLFLYVIGTLELMVAEDYMVVYLNGATPRRRMPGFSWMKKCYQMIDRRLKKNLKQFIIVHPSWFIRTVLGLTRPFISYKFSSKIKYVHSLAELWALVPMEYVQIPASIVRYEEERGIHTFACMRDKKKGNSAV